MTWFSRASYREAAKEIRITKVLGNRGIIRTALGDIFTLGRPVEVLLQGEIEGGEAFLLGPDDENSASGVLSTCSDFRYLHAADIAGGGRSVRRYRDVARPLVGMLMCCA
jgi:hypothetical protein